MDEKLGTHLNAPAMYLHLNGTQTTDKLPLEILVNVPGRSMIFQALVKTAVPVLSPLGEKKISLLF